jgi:hypothetical protein
VVSGPCPIPAANFEWGFWGPGMAIMFLAAFTAWKAD